MNDVLEWVWTFKKPRRVNETSGTLSKQSRTKLARVVSRTPQCILKVTGRIYDSDHLKEHLDYITRNGKAEAHTNYGELTGKGAARDLHQDWIQDADIFYGRENVRRAPLSVNMILAISPGTNRDKFQDAVHDFVDEKLRDRLDVVVCFHDDTDHPHAHVTIRGRDHQGRTFNPGKGTLAKFREQYAECLRHRGIEADATPRYARGQGLKSEKTEVLRIQQRGKTPRAHIRASKEAKKAAGKTSEAVQAKPAGSATRERHLAVRSAYITAARILIKTGNIEDRALAAKIAGYVETQMLPERPKMLMDRFKQNSAAHDLGRNSER